MKRNCYYFDDIIRATNGDIYSTDILLDEKLYKENRENILIYDISYKTLTVAKPLRIRFDKINGFIKIHDKIRYLVLFDYVYCDKILFDYVYCDKICNKIKYLLIQKSGIRDSMNNNNLENVRINSFDSLPIEKIDF